MTIDNDLYEIKTNSRGRRILVVKGLVSIDNVDEVKADDFDAIFVDNPNLYYNELVMLLKNMSVFKTIKCSLKPRFLVSSLKPKIHSLTPVIDGFASTFDDNAMNERIEEIYENLSMIEQYDVAAVRNSNYVLFLKYCKYAISRGQYVFTQMTERLFAKGHTAILVTDLLDLKSNIKEDFYRFNELLVELGYAEQTNFIERIHVCPHCLNSHLYYMECCPKCQSSNIKEEPVLHHFRCANISPESTYAYDGQLRCPKCHQFLRHIGVDYDRPSNMYTCQECNHRFLHTQMKVVCSYCKETLRPYDLLGMDLYDYEYTSEGIQTLSSNDGLIAIGKDLWAGYSKFSSFLSQIRLFSYKPNENETIYVFRVKVEGKKVTNETIVDILGDLQKRYHYVNLTYKDNYIFLATMMPVNLSTMEAEQMKKEYKDMSRIIDSKYSGLKLENQTLLKKEVMEKPDDFINRICQFD